MAVTVPPDVVLLYVVTMNVVAPFYYFLKNEILRYFKICIFNLFKIKVPFGQHVILSTVVSNTKRTNLPNPT